MEPREKYKFYAAEDFANDEAFWLWVIEADPEQTAFWYTFLKENPAKRADIEKAQQLVHQLNTPTPDLPPSKVDQLWQRIETTRRHFPKEKTTRLFNSRKPRQWLMVAATFTLLVIVGALSWQWLHTPNLVTLATTYGQSQEFRLLDGSVVLLNANSSLKYRSNWQPDQPREVWLTGEGYFDIRSKKNKQEFLVHAGSVSIKVLGTTFNVNHRRQEIKVGLRTGRISLGFKQTTAQPLLLKPGDFVTYQEQSAKLTKETVDPASFLAWKDNLLVFKAESLRNIFQMLQDNYNLQIRIADSTLLNRKFTGTVPADDLSVLFMGLQEGHNLKINQVENQIHIKSKVAGQNIPAPN